MKLTFQRGVLAASIALGAVIPAFAFAQSATPLTRAQVRAELVELELAGWHPGAGSDPHYPDDILAAEATVAARHAAAGAAAQSGYGDADQGTSESGGPRK
ncbi:DUF4148 domain-containing protein [Paraburkholderia aromaticivorans]|uniref:DUF4148 domain-containing protein n=1 Tax=Paraburkholderia aromaticivorans TaxID=2026199 RepID=A0A248VSN3_9BURK|nr:DUF4148 domain-containing protein [Paraburkholderia aromaticivorans]ASW01885.1 hypothetical protein CJU94_27510 [Paraburkholderia aromaticivorans]